MELHGIGGPDLLQYGGAQGEPSAERQREARRILRNKFNYQEVGVQTRIKVVREKGVSTAKPCLQNFSGEASPSKIF